MPVRLKKASILVYRIFDVSEEINIAKVQAILRDNRGPHRFRVPKFIDRGIVIKNPPVTFGMGEEILRIRDQEVKAEVFVKVRDFGVLSILYQIPIDPGTAWPQLISFASALEEGAEVDVAAKQQADLITKTISAALTKPHERWHSFEDYTVYFIESLEDNITPLELVQKADVPSLLLAEDKVKISEETRKSILENIYQYGESDLTLIEWNSALVVEPGGGREIPDILEFAVTHLMEMRFYDDLLDHKLNVLYNDIERKRKSIWSTRYDQVYAEATTRYIEFLEFLERVENSLKVVGDFYLATIYRSATRRFRLSDWQNSVTRKMNILAQVSNLLQGEINVRKSHWMEIIIILLISYEILMALWFRK